MARMKSLARSYVLWPGLDKDIEDLAKTCLACHSHKHTPAVTPLHPWIWTEVFEISNSTVSATIATL